MTEYDRHIKRATESLNAALELEAMPHGKAMARQYAAHANAAASAAVRASEAGTTERWVAEQTEAESAKLLLPEYMR
ncbi:hypothetical protein PBI_LICORICE_88 [Mycobacterium phage Licorice]|nr:hypothetical protein SEA_BIGPAOLINI_84 [Mycobacterium phage BigPaolini]WAB09672.1 hypothetical protein PBI_LICORICE_88 [Mycobacterium phage Licorice]